MGRDFYWDFAQNVSTWRDRVDMHANLWHAIVSGSPRLGSCLRSRLRGCSTGSHRKRLKIFMGPAYDFLCSKIDMYLKINPPAFAALRHPPVNVKIRMYIFYHLRMYKLLCPLPNTLCFSREIILQPVWVSSNADDRTMMQYTVYYSAGNSFIF